MIEDLLKVVILSLIEGVTEFLPVSSTGHLIVGASLLRFDALLPPIFEIFIQIGAVAAVLVYYRQTLGWQVTRVRRSADARRFWLMIALASAPVAALGVMFQREIELLFFSPQVVATSLILGGIAIILVERLPQLQLSIAAEPNNALQVTWREAALIGLVQVLALIPGMSRSASSIVGGMLAGLSRRAATEFSFFLAIPLLASATLYKFFTTVDSLGTEQVLLLILGAVLSGAFSWLAIDLLLRFISRRSFVAFGCYRIAAGALILLGMSVGVIT